MAALMKGAVSEPLTRALLTKGVVQPGVGLLTECHGLVCNEDASQIVIPLKRVKDCLKGRELSLVPSWQGLGRCRVRNLSQWV